MTPQPSAPPLHPRIAFTHHDFRLLALARLALVLGSQMQSVAIGWQIYAMTRSPMHLGMIGLVQFIPNFIFALVAGHAADRFDRRQVIRVCQSAAAAGALLLALLTLHGHAWIGWYYLLLFAFGTARVFQAPAIQALLPLIVPAEHFANAVTWNSSIFQFATILGPSLGGLVYCVGGPATVYLINTVLILAALAAVSAMRTRPGRLETGDVSWQTVLAGVRYIFAKRIILGCISLDLFAVLLGGATALLPAFASDILHVGPAGLGMLRGAPAIGALLTGLALAHLPPLRRAGAAMLACVAGFGLATIVFGLSKSFLLSLACLAFLGAFDMVSVIVRHTLVQVLTPKAMLGRVSAVNMVFIGASNELGEFESGLTAAWFGLVPAVVLGGAGTILIVALWAILFPDIRKIGRLDKVGLAKNSQEAINQSP